MTVEETIGQRLWPVPEVRWRDPSCLPFLAATLLEEGDTPELAWLVTQTGEERLAEWLARRGGRKLSRRSRAFWELVLDREAGGGETLSRVLWPLA